MPHTAAQTLVDGLAFPEGARWHNGRLWFSDTYDLAVLCLDPESGIANRVAEVPGGPSGLGFLPDGRLLIASARDRQVLRREEDGTLHVHANLFGIASWHLNDMVVDAYGRAFVGNYGDDSAPPQPPQPADLAMVEPDGAAHVVATEMMFATGLVITRDGTMLIVAESGSAPCRLTGFSIEPDGSLTNRRTLIEFDSSVYPGGLAIDGEDGIWVASPFSAEVIRVTTSGTITDRMTVENPYAVALGGPDGRDLFVCTSDTWVPEDATRDRTGAIRRLRVTVPAG